MNTCSTCKHWDDEDSHEDARLCHLLIKKRETGVFILKGRPWLGDGVVFSGSLDEDRNQISTGPNFGCIHWEAPPLNERAVQFAAELWEQDELRQPPDSLPAQHEQERPPAHPIP